MRLKPVRLQNSYWGGIEYEINSIFWKIFYGPLSSILGKQVQELHNSEDVVIEALRSGKIYYADGGFHGQFNSKLSKEFLKLGGKFDKRTQTWVVPGIQIPPAVSMAIAESEMKYKDLQKSIFKIIDGAAVRSDQIIADAPIAEEYQKVVGHINEDWLKTIKLVAIPPKLTNASKKIIADEWGTNLKLYIKKWTDENIITLREQVSQNVYAGGRAAGLTKIIEKNYTVSKEKAKFLARQETSLLMSKFTQQRYAEIGIQKYMWSGAMDERERHDHKILEGKIFFFEHPPVTNLKSGAKNNPGEDFNCRCVAIPVVEGGELPDTKEEIKKYQPSRFKKLFSKQK